MGGYWIIMILGRKIGLKAIEKTDLSLLLEWKEITKNIENFLENIEN